MAVRQRVLGSGHKCIHIRSHLIQLTRIARNSRIVAWRFLDAIQILAKSLEVRSEMPPSMRTRSEIGCDPLAGRQEHTISNCVRIESISQKVDHRVVSEMLKQDVMILKHATATFWR